MNALVIGGTGATGPVVVRGLVARGYGVTILHRGTHESPELAQFEHIHADPHFEKPLSDAIAGRSFDVAVVMYGRLRAVAEVLRRRVRRVVAVTGAAVYRGVLDPVQVRPAGAPVPLDETADVAREQDGRLGAGIAAAEGAVLRCHEHGDFSATIIRYPVIYGPNQLRPAEWAIVRRLLDGRRSLILPDGGLSLFTRGFVENVALAVLLAVDHPEVAGGKTYNCGDRRVFTLRQWVQLIADALGLEMEIVSVPWPAGTAASALMPVPIHTSHLVLDTTRIRRELGYEDLVPPEAAIAQTARWYRDHPLQRGGADEQRLGDAFDYEAEDAVIDVQRRYMSALHEVAGPPMDRPHVYAHPTAPNLSHDHRGR